MWPTDENELDMLLEENDESNQVFVTSLIEIDKTQFDLPPESCLSYPDKLSGTTDFFTLEQFQPFSQFANNIYFWKNYIHKMKENKDHGGLKGVVWRAVRRQSLYLETKLANLADTKTMVNVTNHMLNCTSSQQEDFTDLMDNCLSYVTIEHHGSSY